MAIRNFFRRLLGRSPAPASSNDGGLFRAMVEQSGDVIGHVVDGRFTYVSPSARTIFGWNPEAMIGTTGIELIHEPDVPMLEEVLARTASGELGLIRHQLRVVCGDGSVKWTETTAHSERGPDGRTRTVLVIRDISEQKRTEAELEALALRDGLTGLANRRAFDEMLDRAWRQTLRQGGEMALLMIDIDHFKRFNDAFGHQAGDDCLRAVAAAIGAAARRPTDHACRYGGEEFAVILCDADAAIAKRMADEIRAGIAALYIPHHNSAEGPGHVTVSIGAATAVARVGGSIRMPEGLVQAADHAMYKAKAGGRDRVEEMVLIAPSERA